MNRPSQNFRVSWLGEALDPMASTAWRWAVNAPTGEDAGKGFFLPAFHRKEWVGTSNGYCSGSNGNAAFIDPQ